MATAAIVPSEHPNGTPTVTRQQGKKPRRETRTLTFEVMAEKALTATLDGAVGTDRYSVEATLRTGRSTGGHIMLDYQPTAALALREAANFRDGGLTVTVPNFDALISLHATLGVMIEKARVEGWHNCRTGYQGCDADLMPAEIEIAAIRAVLSRPSQGFVRDELGGCTCRQCNTLRTAPFVCKHCGYDGQPFVWRCTCERSAKESLGWQRELLARVQAGEVVQYDGTSHGGEKGTYTAKQVRARIAELRKTIAAGGFCGTTGEAQECGHGDVECPVCENAWEGCYPDGKQLAGMFRDIRAIVDGRAASFDD
jgi:hypothetical protein